MSERRTTSVLFGDLVSFTTLSEQRDPEEVRELLSAYFAVARTVVGRYGGTIEKFIGDAVMAVWGVPVAHEDDAERAVRAGLDLVAEVTALGASVGAPGLAMRVGVVTGSVAVTLGAVNEGMVAGDAVNTAARVQSAAEPGTVWTDGETRSLTAAAVAYADMGEHPLKGKAEPVRLFRAEAIVAARGGAQRVDGLEAPLTGRDGELRAIRTAFHATEDDGLSRLVLVEGQAGTGKTRLGWEFEKYADGLSSFFAWHRGRCLSYGEGVSFWAFAEMVRSRLGILEGDDRATVETKVRDGVAKYVPDPTEAAWVVPRLLALLTGGDRMPGMDRADLFSAWSVFLERAAEGDPVVLLFEDMQHADAGLLDLVEHLLESCGAKLYVLCLARPDLRERRPSLVAGPRSVVLDLPPLEDAAMTQLVDALVTGLPDAARTALVTRAEGVPLYAVETVRSLIDRDAVIARDGRYVFDDPDGTKVDLNQLAAPTSLQTLIAARLDALTVTERRTVQDAAVLGLSFRKAAVAHLSDVSDFDLDVALLGLVRKGIVETQTDPRSPEVGSYRFLQALVREVAYGTLARKDRRTRHLAAAAYLETEDVDAADSYAGIIAQHLLDALDASGATDPDRTGIAARARALLRIAADRALSLGSPEEALHCGLAALDLDPDPVEQAALRLSTAVAALDAGRYDQAVDLAVAAGTENILLGDVAGRIAAATCRGRALIMQGRQTEARDLLVPLLDEVEDTGLPGLLDLSNTLCNAARALGDLDTVVRTTFLACRLGEQIGSPEHVVNSLNSLAILAVNQGSHVGFTALIQSAVDIAREHQLLQPLARSLGNLLGEICQQDLAQSVELADEALVVGRRAGNRERYEIIVSNALSAYWLAGRWDRALAELTELIPARSGGTVGVFAVIAAGTAAFVHAEQGRPVPPLPDGGGDDPYVLLARGFVEAFALEGAGDAVAAARVVADAFEECYSEAELEDFDVVAAVAVDLQLRAGDATRARRLMSIAAGRGEATPLARAQITRLHAVITAAEGGDPEAGLRAAEAAFEVYGAPFYLARTRFELARWLRAQDRGDESDLLWDQARATFIDLGAERSLAEMVQLVNVV